MLVGLPLGVVGVTILFVFILVLQYAPGARMAAPRGRWPSYFSLVYFRLVYLYNMHQVLIRLPQGVGGLAILFYFIFTMRTRCS